MYQIRTFNNIAPEGLNLLDKSYALNESNHYDAILLRSQNLHNMEFSPTLKAIAEREQELIIFLWIDAVKLGLLSSTLLELMLTL